MSSTQNSIHFELIAPEGMVAAQAVQMVTLPAEMGEMGVLAGHVPVITSLQPGLIKLFDGDKVSAKLFVSGGFAEVQPDRCTVLADAAEDLANTSVDKLNAQAADVETQLNSAAGDDAAALSRQLETLRLKARLLAA